MTFAQLLSHARIAVQTVGAASIDDPRAWELHQLARGVLDLFDSARSSTGPVNIARLRAIAAGAGVHDELVRLLEVFEAACTWRDEQCSNMPGCDMYDGSHDNDCDINVNMRRLCSAVDSARGQQ